MTAFNKHARRLIERKSGGGDNGDALEIKSVLEALKTRDAEIQAFCAKASEEIKSTGKMATDTHAALELLAKQGNELQARLTDLEQKGLRAGGAPTGQKSWGEAVVEAAGFKSMVDGRQGRTGRIEVKAVTSAEASAGTLVPTQRLPGIIAPPDRPLTVRDLIMPGRTTSNAIEYVKETLFTNSAAPVAENTLKPESDLSFELATTNVRTIAHWVLATKQILDDAPQLASYIDGRLRYGLAYVEEQQLLLGNGVGQNLLGLIPQATAFNAGLRKAGDTKIDTIRHAALQVRLAEYRASAIVINPLDWEDIELTKTDDKAYVFANPTAQTQPRLWGLPVVESAAVAAGEFLVGAFNLAAQVFDRETTTVEVSTEDRDNFVKNMITVRAEERLALAVYRPQSFVHGTFVP